MSIKWQNQEKSSSGEGGFRECEGLLPPYSLIDQFKNISQIVAFSPLIACQLLGQHRLRLNCLLSPTQQAGDRHRLQFAFCHLILTRTHVQVRLDT
ncbi:MAG: hypothetical protein V7L25_13760 [Nostoc sp.]